MHAYECWHYLCRETLTVIIALSSWEARKRFARSLGVRAVDVIAKRVQ